MLFQPHRCNSPLRYGAFPIAVVDLDRLRGHRSRWESAVPFCSHSAEFDQPLATRVTIYVRTMTNAPSSGSKA